MLLFWRIRCCDTRDQQFKDRDLWLMTDELDPVTKAAVEACYELKETGGATREMLKYRRLFQEHESPWPKANELLEKCGRMGTILIHDYFEDENGEELTSKRIAALVTGSESAVMLPSGAKQHDIDYILADKPPIEIDKISLSPDQLKVIGCFTRDLRELLASAFYKEGPGSLCGIAGDVLGPTTLPMTVKTAVTDEEIRSFVTVFRRLYMRREWANFQNAAAVFVSALSGHPLGKWTAGEAAEIAAELERPPDFIPFVGNAKPSFTLKRLIDVFLYTQYVHQPDQDRSRQFQQCLQEVGNDRSVLTYLFLSELWSLTIHMSNVGRQIAQFFDVYCREHKVSCDIITSPTDAHPGIGTLEKKHEREERILRERAEDLAKALWEQEGRPAGGHAQYVADALAKLRAAMQSSIPSDPESRE